MDKNQKTENHQLKCGCYRLSYFCPTIRNSKTLSAEEMLKLFHNTVYSRKPLCIEEFVPAELINKQVEIHELFDNHWDDCYTDLNILHSTTDDTDPDMLQVVAALPSLDEDNEFEEYEQYDVITLRRDTDRGWWIISSVFKLLLNDEYKNPLMLPVFGSDPILLATHEFLKTEDWNIEESDNEDCAEPIDMPLEVCKEGRSDFEKLPPMVKAFYLTVVRIDYESGWKVPVDFFSLEFN
jgi:hypothetical protein